MPLPKLSPWHIDLGNKIRAVRKAKGLTMQDVAGKLGCTYQMYQRYESATGRMPADVLVRVAAILGTAPSTLLPETQKGLPDARASANFR